jgi:hypothetical protein
MNRKDLQSLADERLEDARVLLANKRHGGAYYPVGYAVECGLKACIAKLTQAEDFYDKTLARNVFQHGIGVLANLARLSTVIKQFGEADPLFEANWAQVTVWDEESRYETHTQAEAEQMMKAVEDQDHGVMQCIKQYW